MTEEAGYCIMHPFFLLPSLHPSLLTFPPPTAPRTPSLTPFLLSFLSLSTPNSLHPYTTPHHPSLPHLNSLSLSSHLTTPSPNPQGQERRTVGALFRNPRQRLLRRARWLACPLLQGTGLYVFPTRTAEQNAADHFIHAT